MYNLKHGSKFEVQPMSSL